MAMSTLMSCVVPVLAAAIELIARPLSESVPHVVMSGFRYAIDPDFAVLEAVASHC